MSLQHDSSLSFHASAAGYADLTRRLVTALQESIGADIGGATENEVIIFC